MKAHDLLTLLAMGLLIALCFGAFGALPVSPLAFTTRVPVDWQKRAEESTWDFDYRPNDLKQCVERVAGKYTAKTTPVQNKEGQPVSLLVTIMKGDKPVFEFEAHTGTVLAIDGDRIYYSNHHTGTSGATIVAADLPT